MIAAATPKRHYYVTSPRGSRLFELGLGAVALAFLSVPSGQTMDEMRRQLEPLVMRHGADWPAVWLEMRGHAGWATELRRIDGDRTGQPAAAERSTGSRTAAAVPIAA